MTDKSKHGMSAEAAEDSIARASINSTVAATSVAPKTPAGTVTKCVLK